MELEYSVSQVDDKWKAEWDKPGVELDSRGPEYPESENGNKGLVSQIDEKFPEFQADDEHSGSEDDGRPIWCGPAEVVELSERLMQSTNQDTDELEPVKLIRKISTLESNEFADLPSTRTLRDLKSQYNALIKQNMPRTRYPDLFEYLPTEIWMHILLELWIFINIRGDLDALELAHSALFLSKGLPLSITVDVPMTPIVQETFLKREVARIQHLTIVPGFRYLQTSSRLETVIPKLVKLTALKALSLFDSSREEQETPSKSYTKVCNIIAPIEYLRLFQTPSTYIWPLLAQVISRTRELGLKIRWGDVFELFTAIHEAPYLHRLEIIIMVDPDEDVVKATGWKAPTLLQIQCFQLSVYERQAIFVAKALLDALDGSLANLQTLHFHCDIFASDLVRFLKGMEHLNILNVLGYVENDEAGMVSCPSLKTLIAKTEGVLCYVSMPNLLSLTINSTYDLEKSIKCISYPDIDRSFVTSVQSLSLDTRIAAILIPDDTKFTQLLTLEWIGSGSTYFHLYHPFTSLTKINFAAYNQNLGASYFCELLLRYPRLCPRLKTICMHEYPEWDMLLYMLLRRNVYQSQDNISRITSIGLPGYPAPSILVPLKTLLLGKIPLVIPSLEGFLYYLILSDLTMWVTSILVIGYAYPFKWPVLFFYPTSNMLSGKGKRKCPRDLTRLFPITSETGSTSGKKKSTHGLKKCSNMKTGDCEELAAYDMIIRGS
ncbi:4990_t:CDS:2 [Acaulospora colombiana]|uniref:4990_t:CDS:1 n=1 Tax=Acaulospora colombiana TaxID=27376 RepID=A0ACA9KRC1_9GLOM|nr:4990_t:CDS:2 [Acaulospora colombiana]